MRACFLLCCLFVYGCSSDKFEVTEQPDGSGDDTSVTPTDDTATVDTTTPPGDVSPPPCDPAEKPDPAAVFVSGSTGNDSSGDGSSATPYKTLYKALVSAKVKLAPKIVLDQGTYGEPVVIGDTDFPLTIEGGWRRIGTAWSRACEPSARDLTLIQSPSAVGVAVKDARKRTGLAHLSVCLL